jgi:hypothetical protein
VQTGTPKRSAKPRRRQRFSLQRPPPRISMGRSLWASNSSSAAIWASPGTVSNASTKGASGECEARQDIMRQRQHHRALAARQAVAKARAHHLAHAVGFVHFRHPFGQSAEEGAVIHFLKGVAAAILPLHLSHETGSWEWNPAGRYDAAGRIGGPGRA